MIPLNNVLVAFDFGESSQKALAYARNLTRALGGHLHVLHVADVIATTAAQFYPDAAGNPEVRTASVALQHLRAFLSDVDGTPAVRISGSPAHAIVEYAKSVHADMIVMGTHGRDGVSRLLMGSVAEHVVRHAPCPVLVVRRSEHEFIVDAKGGQYEPHEMGPVP
jgi:nucleotide-binding universal stress UspA family protein